MDCPPGEDVISLALNEADTFQAVLNITSGEKEAEVNRMALKIILIQMKT